LKTNEIPTQLIPRKAPTQQ